jgi:hypothetical protein
MLEKITMRQVIDPRANGRGVALCFSRSYWIVIPDKRVARRSGTDPKL